MRTGPLSAGEQARRAEDARQVRHSIAMSGGSTSPQTRADQDAYARGEIDEDEMVRRVRTRFGLPRPDQAPRS